MDFSTRKISRSLDFSTVFLTRQRIVNKVSSVGPLPVVFGRDRTDRTDNRTDGTSLGMIDRVTGFETLDDDLDLAVKGGCKAVGDGCETGEGIEGAARFGGDGNGSVFAVRLSGRISLTFSFSLLIS
jgi:hypothetical protein